MPLYGYNRGPWYRGGVPRSYVAPHMFVSVGCGCCLLFFSIFFIIAGGAIFGTSQSWSKQMNEPPFDDPFFKRHGGTTGSMETVGIALLSIGCIMFSISVILCVTVACLAKKQEAKRRTNQQDPLVTAAPQPPPPSAYPHQPQNVYPPAGGYPAQPVVSGTTGVYPPPGSYPPQPVVSGTAAGYYPPLSTAPPPQGNLYPPPSYSPQSVPPNAPPQSFLNEGDFIKQPLEQNP